VEDRPGIKRYYLAKGITRDRYYTRNTKDRRISRSRAKSMPRASACGVLNLIRGSVQGKREKTSSRLDAMKVRPLYPKSTFYIASVARICSPKARRNGEETSAPRSPVIN